MAESPEGPPEDEELAEPEELWSSVPADEPRPSHRRCVVHIDIDCFYAQVEMLERPELRERPLGIQQKNIVVTSNYVARARGVGKCCLVEEALRACPDLVLVNGSDLTRYRRMSARVHRVLTRFSRRVERLGFDENFLDVTEEVAARLAAGAVPVDVAGHVFAARRDGCACGCASRLAVGSQVAADVRRALREDLGITSCAGVGFNKLLAKLACAAHKPNQQTTVFAGGVDALLLGAGGARRLPGVGSRTATLLAEQGVETVQDLRRAPAGRLEAALGRSSAAVRALAFGADETDVKTSSAALSIGVEDGFKRVDSIEECEVKLRELARRVLGLLQEDGRVPTVLKVSVRRYHKDDYYRFRETRQSKVSPSLFAKCVTHADDVTVIDRIVAEAMVLLKKMLKAEPFHLTLLGLAVTGFPEGGESAQSGISKFLQKAAPSAGKRKQPEGSGGDRDRCTPSGVDESVWSGLPPDIRSELLQGQELGPGRKRRQQSIARYLGGGSGCRWEDAPDAVALAVGGDRGAPPAPADPAGKLGRCVARSSSGAPVEAWERPETEPNSDPDDPGSPVVSRSSASQSVVEGDGHRRGFPLASGDSPGTSETAVSGLSVPSLTGASGPGCSVGVAEALPAGHCSLGARDCVSPGGIATSPTVAIKGAESVGECPVEPHSLAQVVHQDAECVKEIRGVVHAPRRSPCAQGAEFIGKGPALLDSSPVDREVECMEEVPRVPHSSPGRRKVETGSRKGEGLAETADRRSSPPPDAWDPDVFSQLPPDIQFELKLSRRQSRPPPPPKASPRKPTTRSGPILKFFKK